MLMPIMNVPGQVAVTFLATALSRQGQLGDAVVPLGDRIARALAVLVELVPGVALVG